MYRHVAPFLKSINTALPNCSLRDGTLASIYQLNLCSMFLTKCFAGSEFLLTSLCSSQLILQFLIVSSTYVSPHEQIPL